MTHIKSIVLQTINNRYIPKATKKLKTIVAAKVKQTKHNSTPSILLNMNIYNRNNISARQGEGKVQ